MRNLHFFVSGLTAVILAMALAAPSFAQAGQPAGGKVLYLRDEAACVSTPTPPSAYPLPEAQQNCHAPQTLVVAGADGRIVREARLPARVSSYAFSPDGAWMAYHTGDDTLRPNQIGETDPSGCGPEPSDLSSLSLNLLNIQTGDSKLVTKLLGSDFPNNIVELKQYDQHSADYPGFPVNICWTFTDGIRKMAWSSDSQHLAFAGEMDGPSSDLYVLDMPTQNIRRLSDGIENIRAIDWSPDNKWIMHASLLWEGAWAGWNLHFAAADGSAMKSRGQMKSFLGWLDKDNYLEGECGNGLGCAVIDKVNVQTGLKTHILQERLRREGSDMMAHDVQNRVFALGVGFNGNLALVNSRNLQTSWISGYKNAAYIGKGDVRMILWDSSDPSHPIGILRKNGSIKNLLAFISPPSTNTYSYRPQMDGISPDGKYVIIPQAGGLYVYRIGDGMLVRSIKMDLPQPPVKDDYKAGVSFFWPSQSAALVKVTQPGEAASKLYALDFLQGQPQLVDSGVLSGEMVVGK